MGKAQDQEGFSQNIPEAGKCPAAEKENLRKYARIKEKRCVAVFAI